MRYHPSTIAFRIYQLVKNSLVIWLFLFVLRKDSEFWLFEYGRYAFVIYITLRLLYIMLAWFAERYEQDDHEFRLHKGIFVKQTHTIPFSAIQNVTRKNTIFHKLIGHTSLTFETAMDGKDDAIHFEVITERHANELMDLVKKNKKHIPKQGSEKIQMNNQVEEEWKDDYEWETERTVHYTSNRKDLWKASFTSLSFLALIPIVIGVFDDIEPLLPDADQFNGIFDYLFEQVWMLVLVIMVAVVFAVTFGVARTFLRYGKYEISSNSTHIYINRGMVNESYFSIGKRKIQGLEIKQTILKRLFGLAEVKLISSANPNKDEDAVQVNSLYPFLPSKEAYRLIEELVPTYQLSMELERLPRKSLWVKLLKRSLLWIIATIALVFFKPEVFQIEQAWWVLSVILFCILILHGVLDYMHTKYDVTSDQVEWWHGGFTSRMFITKRKNVIELAYSQTNLQKRFGIASIKTVSRSIPAHTERIHDVPLSFALEIEAWYLKRYDDVQLEKTNNKVGLLESTM